MRKASKVNKGATDQDNGAVYADDLVTLQLTTLQRLRGGKIDGRTATIELAAINSLFKGIEIADLQARLERLEHDLNHRSH